MPAIALLIMCEPWFNDDRIAHLERIASRGGYWRRYEASTADYRGRGRRDYQRSDDRIREESATA